MVVVGEMEAGKSKGDTQLGERGVFVFESW